jgi:hypothetical protein
MNRSKDLLVSSTMTKAVVMVGKVVGGEGDGDDCDDDDDDDDHHHHHHDDKFTVYIKIKPQLCQ